MAATDPAARRNKLDGKKEKLAQRALTVLFGDNPAGAERLAFGVLFFIPECLPDLADLSDAELREALQTTIVRMLRSYPDHRGREASSISMPMRRATRSRSASQASSVALCRQATAAIMQSMRPWGVTPDCRQRR